MELLERIVVGCLFGLPGIALIVFNYYRIFSKKPTGSPAYLIGGIFGAIGVLAVLGSEYKSRWYFILIPIVLDWGLFLVSLIRGWSGPKERNKVTDEEENEA